MGRAILCYLWGLADESLIFSIYSQADKMPVVPPLQWLLALGIPIDKAPWGERSTTGPNPYYYARMIFPLTLKCDTVYITNPHLKLIHTKIKQKSVSSKYKSSK